MFTTSNVLLVSGATKGTCYSICLYSKQALVSLLYYIYNAMGIESETRAVDQNAEFMFVLFINIIEKCPVQSLGYRIYFVPAVPSTRFIILIKQSNYCTTAQYFSLLF